MYWVEANCLAAGNIIKFFVRKRCLSCCRYGGKDVGKDVPCEVRGERQIEEMSEQLQGEFPGGCETYSAAALCWDRDEHSVRTAL
jgi:hypothetical protein